MNNPMYLLGTFILFIIVYKIIKFIFRKITYNSRINNIAKLTDEWIYNVTKLNDPKKIYNMFCDDGKLLGTVSTVIRNNNDIKKYFNYFAKLPNIKVIDSKYNIYNIGGDIYTNTAFITWVWDGVEPIVARMTFIFKGNCIMQLHSSALPTPPKELNE